MFLSSYLFYRESEKRSPFSVSTKIHTLKEGSRKSSDSKRRETDKRSPRKRSTVNRTPSKRRTIKTISSLLETEKIEELIPGFCVRYQRQNLKESSQYSRLLTTKPKHNYIFSQLIVQNPLCNYFVFLQLIFVSKLSFIFF